MNRSAARERALLGSVLGADTVSVAGLRRGDRRAWLHCHSQIFVDRGGKVIGPESVAGWWTSRADRSVPEYELWFCIWGEIFNVQLFYHTVAFLLCKIRSYSVAGTAKENGKSRVVFRSQHKTLIFAISRQCVSKLT